MPLVAVVVGAIGTAVGTAVGGALAGTAFGAAAGMIGLSAGALGGIIGAGIAGGALGAATGGSFGKGFLMGAAGAAIGGFLKGGLGDAVGAGTGEAAGSLAEGASEGLNAAGYMAPEMGTSVAGDISATAGGGGFGELGGIAGEGAGGMSTTGDLFSGMGEVGPTMSQVPTTEGGFSLENLTEAAPTPATDSFSLSAMPTDTTSAIGSIPTPSLGTDQFALTPGMTTEAPLLSTDYAPAPMESAGGIEGSAPSWGGDMGTPTAGSYPMEYAETAAAQPKSSGGLGGMFKSSDAWLKNTFGQSAPSTGKLLMGGGQYLMDKYQTDKLERQAKGLAPMSFEQYQQQFSNVDDYRNASARMAQSGRTGTLPALLARLKERTRAGYANYLPGAKQQYLGTQADIAGARSRSLGNLFRNVVA